MHPASLAQLELLTTLKAQLEAAAHGTATALTKAAAQRMGVSMQTVCSRLRAVGYQSGRKLRSDKNSSLCDRDSIMKIAAIFHARPRENGKQIASWKGSLSISKGNGIVAREIGYSTALRVAREFGVDVKSMRQPSPHVQMKSKHPNHVWQIDASICVLYYLPSGQLRAMDHKKFNDRKPKAIAGIMHERVLRYAVTDHCSGAVFCRYYLTAGESQITLFEFLMDAMHAKEGDVMHGVPFMIVWDLGSANVSHAIKALFKGLGVDTYEHASGQPRAKGQVEGVHNIIEKEFEGRLSMLKVSSIEQLNSHLGAWLRVKNGVDIHTRHKHTRWALWQTIRSEELRLCPTRAVCEMLMMSKPETRVVKGQYLMIEFKVKGFDSMLYSLKDIPTVRVGDQVEVSINPYAMPNVFVRASNEQGVQQFYECKPSGKNVNGFLDCANTWGEDYKSAPRTRTDDMRDELNTMAWGTADRHQIEALKRKGLPAFGGAIDPMADIKQAQVPEFIQRRGTQLTAATELPKTERITMDVIDVLRAVRDQLERRLTPEENTHIRATWPQGCLPEQLPAVIESLAPTTAVRPRLALVK